VLERAILNQMCYNQFLSIKYGIQNQCYHVTDTIMCLLVIILRITTREVMTALDVKAFIT